MNHPEFASIVENRLADCQRTLIKKNEEYSSETNRLHNFVEAAGMTSGTPEQALWGMVAKHLVSVKDIVTATACGEVPCREKITEKLGDVINYMLLLEGLLEDRRLLPVETLAQPGDNTHIPSYHQDCLTRN